MDITGFIQQRRLLCLFEPYIKSFPESILLLIKGAKVMMC